MSGASLAVIAALSAPPAAAQSSTDLEPIVVETGTGDNPAKSIVSGSAQSTSKSDTPILKSANSVSVVTEKEIETRAAQSMQAVVSYTSGVSVDEFGSDDRYDYYRIRGFDQTALGTYRDGLPARIPAWYTAARLEPYGLERVEVLKGSTSTLFGLNGPGGLINAVTKKPTKTPFGEVYTTLGTDNHVETGLDIGGPFSPDSPWAYRITVKGQKADGSYDYSKDDRLYVAPALTYSPDDTTSLTLLTDFSKRNGAPARGIPHGVNIDIDTFLGEPDYNRFDTIQADAGYEFMHRFDNGVTFRQNARYSHTDLDYQEVYGATADPTADRTSFGADGNSNRFAIDNQLQYDRDIGSARNKLLVGSDFTYDNTREDIVYGTAGPIDIYNPTYCGLSCVHPAPYVNWKVKQSALGIYAQDELTLFDKLTLTGGLRYDTVDSTADYLDSGTSDHSTENALTKRLGASYLLTPELSAYANYSESFQPLVAPSANGYAVGGSLKPQEGTQYEVGLKFKPEDFKGLFTLAFFDLTQTNVPSWNDAHTVQKQIGEVRVRGVELEGKFEVFDRLNATLAYSYWDGEITGDGDSSLVGNTPERVPHHIASAWLDYTIPGTGKLGDLTLGAGARYVGSTYGDAANTVKVASHIVFDAMAAYKVTDNVTLQVNATNLFDEKYVATSYYGTDFYGDGRAVFGTLKYNW
ncbi:TonB-dependent siderophore receptor [Pleomorphomonas oryzae]|uniref:TonB-dependent siderophore receptor n=1 Tax=Pleomorphomonas oryzae TaxID=261934 RepID=UPI0003F98D6E|nr:TonB-dependent siderophore receptor [Pleomorphomonas oryzae]